MKDTSYVAATGCWTLKSPGFISLSERGGYRQKVERNRLEIYAITSTVLDLSYLNSPDNQCYEHLCLIGLY